MTRSLEVNPDMLSFLQARGWLLNRVRRNSFIWFSYVTIFLINMLTKPIITQIKLKDFLSLNPMSSYPIRHKIQKGSRFWHWKSLFKHWPLRLNLWLHFRLELLHWRVSPKGGQEKINGHAASQYSDDDANNLTKLVPFRHESADHFAKLITNRLL